MFNFHQQKARNNARPPDTAKLRWKGILSVLDPTFVCAYKISRKQWWLVETLYQGSATFPQMRAKTDSARFGGQY